MMRFWMFNEQEYVQTLGQLRFFRKVFHRIKKAVGKFRSIGHKHFIIPFEDTSLWLVKGF